MMRMKTIFLINNAFQAVKGVDKPMVVVSTRRVDSPLGVGGEREQHQTRIEITISDNGPGIPEEIKDKIFQPFFTTKPTGEGTGLGLSLSYDIVKAHGGEIKVVSDEQTGTEFRIILPTK